MLTVLTFQRMTNLLTYKQEKKYFKLPPETVAIAALFHDTRFVTTFR